MLRIARIVVDAFHRHLERLSIDMYEVVVRVAVRLPRHKVEPLQAVQFAHDSGLDLLPVRRRKTLQIGGRHACVGRFGRIALDERRCRHPLRLLHIEAEYALVDADGVIHDEVVHAQRFGGVLSGDVEIYRLLPEVVAVPASDGEVRETRATFGFALEHHLDAVAARQFVNRSRRALAKLPLARYVGILVRGIHVGILEPPCAGLHYGGDGNGSVEHAHRLRAGEELFVAFIDVVDRFEEADDRGRRAAKARHHCVVVLPAGGRRQFDRSRLARQADGFLDDSVDLGLEFFRSKRVGGLVARLFIRRVGLVNGVEHEFRGALYVVHHLVAQDEHIHQILIIRNLNLMYFLRFVHAEERLHGGHVVVEDLLQNRALRALEHVLDLADFLLERLHDILGDHHPPFADILGDHRPLVVDFDAVRADILESRLHRGDVALERLVCVRIERCGRIVPEGVDLLGDRAEFPGDLLADGGQRVRRAVHRERLARQKLVHLGLENRGDAGIGNVALGRLVQRELPHLAGEMVDFRPAAVAQKLHVEHGVEQFGVHALEPRIRLLHLRFMARHRAEALAQLGEKVREILLGFDRGEQGLAGLCVRVDNPVLVE